MEQDVTHGSASETSNWIWGLLNKFRKWIEGEETPDDPKQLIEMEKVDGTPFTAIKDEGKWWLVMGKYRLTDVPFRNKREAIKDAENITYWRIMQLINIMMTDYETQRRINQSAIDKEKEKERKQK